MKILITGGTGLIGTALTARLLSKGHEVSMLSRSKREIKDVRVFLWDPEKQWIEDGAFEEVDIIVHLAGENIGEEKWTKERKKNIIQSRTVPLEVISKYVRAGRVKVSALVTASAIGYYGGDTGEEILTESSGPGSDFLADCTVQWEEASEKFAKENAVRLVKIRTGLVLSNRGGVLPKLIRPVKWGLGSALGSGEQWLSWIHIDDLVQLYYNAISHNEMTGAYNAVAPHPVSNRKFIQDSAAVLGKKIWLPAFPSFLIRLVLSEMATLVLGSSYVKTQRTEPEDVFRFAYLKDALENLLGQAEKSGNQALSLKQ